MISGEEFTRAVRRSGMGNKGVAEMLGVTTSTIHEYMTKGVRPLRIELVRAKLGPFLDGEDQNPLLVYSDVALLAEVARRMDSGARARQVTQRPDSDMSNSGQEFVPDAKEARGESAHAQTERPARGGVGKAGRPRTLPREAKGSSSEARQRNDPI
jgi:hypothetical protein